jgi:hypothetical protein
MKFVRTVSKWEYPGMAMARETHEARKVQMNRGTRWVYLCRTWRVKETE